MSKEEEAFAEVGINVGQDPEIDTPGIKLEQESGMRASDKNFAKRHGLIAQEKDPSQEHFTDKPNVPAVPSELA